MQSELIGDYCNGERTFPGLYFEPGADCVVLAADEHTAIVVQTNNAMWFVGESFGCMSDKAVLLPNATKITINN